jgi:S-ribosylhomocysteine lyase LuxS involved in autoinducer biosynthesis
MDYTLITVESKDDGIGNIPSRFYIITKDSVSEETLWSQLHLHGFFVDEDEREVLYTYPDGVKTFYALMVYTESEEDGVQAAVVTFDTVDALTGLVLEAAAELTDNVIFRM